MKGRSRATTHGPSFLRWAGSKRKSLALLGSSYRDPTRHYVEPFAGSAALFFELGPMVGTLGDLNGHLVNALRQVRDHAAEVHRRLLAYERSPDAYYAVRNRFNEGSRFGIEAATDFIYLNRNCFNGLWRTNLAGSFNVPFGGHEMGGYPPLELFQDCAKLLRCAKLRHQDFRKTITSAGASSFIYADPPYFTASERVFVEYGKRSFGEEDLSDLVRLLVEAEQRGAEIALTYNEAMPVPAIPSHWHVHSFSVTRNVGGFRGSRKQHGEILYTSFELPGVLE
ncbi:DNA adenine methylase [Sphingomonas sp.]|uniref:DNA adenine methylase n=1 Tax=Sphingomonas sp. TaxID=28214 RepID=UPI003B0095B1